MSSAAINSTVCRVFTAATGSVVSDSTRFRLAAAIDGAIAGVESLDEFEAVSALLSLETFVRGNNRGGEDTRGVVAGRMDWTSLAMLTWAYSEYLFLYGEAR